MNKKPIHQLVITNENFTDPSTMFSDMVNWLSHPEVIAAIDISRRNARLVAEKELQKYGFQFLPFEFYIKEDCRYIEGNRATYLYWAEIDPREE